MKVLRQHAPGKIHIHDEPDPQPGPGQELVHVKAVGICGSDLHWFSEGGIGDAQLDHPLVLGHEFAGTTVRGIPVAVDPAIPCGHCECCRNGNPNLCETLAFAGHGMTDGALREKMAWPASNLFEIPDSISFSDGAMLEPLGVAIHAVDLSHLKAGMIVGVYGCGTIGLMIIQLANLCGASCIIATDKLPHRVKAAIASGATQAIIAQDGREIQEVMAETRGRGVDIAFEAAGEQGAVDVSFSTVVPGGKVILLGVPVDDRTAFTASVARRKGLTIKLVRRMKHTYPRAIDLVTLGKVDVRSLVTHRFGLEDAEEAFATAQRREGIKVMIEV
jgi:L-iditol 2-dehydrogenase